MKIKLSNIAEIIMGQSPEGNSYNNQKIGLPLLNGAADYKGNNFNPKKFTNAPLKIAKKGDILIGIRATIGNLAIADKDYCIGRGLAAIRVSNEVSKKYVSHFLSQQINKLIYNSSGSTIKGIVKEDLFDMAIPLPSLPSQLKIAEILDIAEALRNENQELIKKYDDLAQSIFIDMFGDPIRNEKRWETKTIEQIVVKSRHSIKRGPFGGALKKDIFLKQGNLVYEQYHALNNDFTFERYYISDEKYKELIAFDVQPKDIIISCSGIYLGKLAIVPEGAKKGIINQALLKITLDENIYKNEFFVKVFTQDNFKKTYFSSERGAAIPNFPPMSTFKSFKFICPPVETQNRYLLIAKNLQHQKEIALSELAQTNNLFQTLIKKAFNGELIA